MVRQVHGPGGLHSSWCDLQLRFPVLTLGDRNSPEIYAKLRAGKQCWHGGMRYLTMGATNDSLLAGGEIHVQVIETSILMPGRSP